MRASSIAPALGGRRVLVTGHTGFKGAWLSAWLLELGAEVAGLALDPPTEPSLFAQLGLARRLDDGRGDVRDPAAVEGNESERRLAFADTLRMLRNRIGVFVNLPIKSLDKLSLQTRLREIGRT